MNVLHMNAGNGETSYANNSILQKTVILKARPVLEDTLKNLYAHTLPAECLKIADLGCASGPNTFLVVSEMIDIIHDLSQQNHSKPPEFQIFLNDLPENDFNSIFKLLPTFYKELREKKGDNLGPCFISGVPGSFYCRLFPSNSLHFVHSSYSVHWLSEIPEMPENKGNIYIARTSPPEVFEAYLKQFQRDFSKFLSLRSQEMIPGGRMMLTFIGRSTADPTCKDCSGNWKFLTKSLLDMVSEGLIQEEDVDSFNLPFYTPYKDEVKAIIQDEGSFNLERLEVFEFHWDANGDEFTNGMRAVGEPMVASHFGELIVDDLFRKFAKYVTDNVHVEETNNIIVSLSKKQQK